MPPKPLTAIEILEQSNDPDIGYFCYTTDPAGERGMISANKEGLRLYATELLRIAELMETVKDGNPILFGPHEWMISPTGYDLISGVLPRYPERSGIPPEEAVVPGPVDGKSQDPAGKGCLLQVLSLLLISLILFASVKAFANLHIWGNIH